MQYNSYDFIKKGLKAIISDDEEEYKYAILHLYSGVIIFLKDILFKEHWILIFQDVDKADKSKLFDGTIKSVNHDTLINRLKETEAFNLSGDLYGDLKWMREQRNKIEHLHNELNPHEVRSRIAIFLNNLYNIYHDYESSSDGSSFSKNKNIVEEYEVLFELIKEYSFEFDTFIEKRESMIKHKLEKSYITLTCPNCSRKTLEIIPNDESCFCHFCSMTLNIEDFYYNNSKEYLNEIEYGYGRPQCSNCNSNKVFIQGIDIVCFDCFECYDYEDLTDCARCGISLIYKDHNYEAVFCENCISFIQSQ